MTPYDSTDTSKSDFNVNKPSRDEAEKAVEVLLRWAGDNPLREGLKNSLQVILKILNKCWSAPSRKLRDMMISSCFGILRCKVIASTIWFQSWEKRT